MTEEKQPKLLGEARRHLLIKWLKEEKKAVTGTALAKRANVSRQIIVGDINILKARNEPIVSTPSGYVYTETIPKQAKAQAIIECTHNAEETRAELFTLVDYGVTVKNVSIVHPMYGDLNATIDVSNRYEVEQFFIKMNDTKGTYLSQLANEGNHFHLIEAPSEENINLACEALRKMGILKEVKKAEV